MAKVINTIMNNIKGSIYEVIDWEPWDDPCLGYIYDLPRIVVNGDEFVLDVGEYYCIDDKYRNDIFVPDSVISHLVELQKAYNELMKEDDEAVTQALCAKAKCINKVSELLNTVNDEISEISQKIEEIS